MIEDQPHLLGLSGDHGWNDEDDAAPMGIGTLALMLGHGAYWVSVWLLAGLVPLPALTIRARLVWRNDSKP